MSFIADLVQVSVLGAVPVMCCVVFYALLERIAHYVAFKE